MKSNHGGSNDQFFHSHNRKFFIACHMPGSVPNTEYINITMIKKINFLLSQTIVGWGRPTLQNRQTNPLWLQIVVRYER